MKSCVYHLITTWFILITTDSYCLPPDPYCACMMSNSCKKAPHHTIWIFQFSGWSHSCKSAHTQPQLHTIHLTAPTETQMREGTCACHITYSFPNPHDKGYQVIDRKRFCKVCIINSLFDFAVSHTDAHTQLLLTCLSALCIQRTNLGRHYWNQRPFEMRGPKPGSLRVCVLCVCVCVCVWMYDIGMNSVIWVQTCDCTGKEPRYVCIHLVEYKLVTARAKNYDRYAFG